jgi:hypothetical protein
MNALPVDPSRFTLLFGFVDLLSAYLDYSFMIFRFNFSPVRL